MVRVGRLTQLVIECSDADALAEFWRQMLDLGPATGDEWWRTLYWPPVGRLSFHRVEGFEPPPWPGEHGEASMHFDLLVDDFEQARDRVLALGATELSEVYQPGPEAWQVYADPQGHPFCLVSTPE